MSKRENGWKRKFVTLKNNIALIASIASAESAKLNLYFKCVVSINVVFWCSTGVYAVIEGEEVFLCSMDICLTIFAVFLLVGIVCAKRVLKFLS